MQRRLPRHPRPDTLIPNLTLTPTLTLTLTLTRCSAAYLVTHAGAKLLRAAQTPVWLAADELFKYYTASHNMMLSGSHAATLLARGDTSVKHNADTGSDSVSRRISIWHTRPHLAWQDADLKTAGSDKIPTKEALTLSHKQGHKEAADIVAAMKPSAKDEAAKAAKIAAAKAAKVAAAKAAKAAGSLAQPKLWDKLVSRLVSWVNPHAAATATKATKLQQRTAPPPQPLGGMPPMAPECLESQRLLSSALTDTDTDAGAEAGAGAGPAPLLRMPSTAETVAAARQWAAAVETATTPAGTSPALRSRPISQLLHQTWKECSLSPRQAAWRESCRRQLPPSWRLLLWTDAQNRALVAQRCPAMLTLYAAYPHRIMRADAVRLCYMYALGGVYMDLDFACLRPPTPRLEAAGSRPVFGAAIANHTRRGGMAARGAIGNAFMASPPGHPFFAFAIGRLEPAFQMMSRFKSTRSGATLVLGSTGPNFLTRTVHEYQALLLLPKALLRPLNHQGGVDSDRGGIVVHPLPLLYGVEWTPEGRHPCDAGAKGLLLPVTGAELARCARRLPNAVTTTFWTHSWK